MEHKRSKELFQEAQNILVGGVNSPVRAFGAVGGNPLFIESGKGAYIHDVDGNKYIDYVGSYGPLILGHAAPEVTSRLLEAMKRGTTFGATTEMEVRLAQLVQQAFPVMEMVRFVNSGTEATMSAIRLARGATGRKKILKFAGCYHGHSDLLLTQAGSGLMTHSLPGSAGVTEGTVADTLVAQYNDIYSVEAIFSQFPYEIAAVVVEPVAGNMGVVLPKDGFLGKLRDLTHNYGSLLIIDEVMTGFRNRFGGAQHDYNVQPDITCLGKIIGGGLPVGAYGGSKELMKLLSPLGPVYQAGTLSGNPLAMTAGYQTLKYLQNNPQNYDDLINLTGRLEEGIKEIASELGVAVQVNRYGSMINPFFTETPVIDFATAQTSDTEKFAKFFRELLKGGVYVPPSQFESWFVSMMHDDSDIDKTLQAVRKALKAAKAE